MTAPRTITVHTIDQGAITVPEPAWCNGWHADGEYSVDLTHQSTALCALIDTPCHGLEIFLQADIVQSPLSSRNEISVAVNIGQFHEFAPPSLEALADTLVSHADTLRTLALQLAVLQAEEAGR